jgi:DNA-directed RNA polymerase subunit N (RpoN/RPB10)
MSIKLHKVIQESAIFWYIVIIILYCKTIHPVIFFSTTYIFYSIYFNIQYNIEMIFANTSIIEYWCWLRPIVHIDLYKDEVKKISIKMTILFTVVGIPLFCCRFFFLNKIEIIDVLGVVWVLRIFMKIQNTKSVLAVV